MKEFVKNGKKCYNTVIKEVILMDYAVGLLEQYSNNNKIEKKKNHFFTSFKNNLYSYFSFKILQLRAKEIDFDKYINCNPAIMGGLPTISETRITPNTIFETFSYKMFQKVKVSQKVDSDVVINEIIEMYPTLTEEQVLISVYYVISKISYKKFGNIVCQEQ